MLEIKILCGCGQKYAFAIEPVNGRLPNPVRCPSCDVEGTQAANELIARSMSAPAAAAAPVMLAPQPPAPQAGGLRINKPAETAPVGTAYGAPDDRPLLERSTFFVKEHVGLLKLTDTFDILDPMTQQLIGIAKEEPPGWAKWLRLVVDKSKLPTKFSIYEAEDQPPVVTVKRGFTMFQKKIHVIAGDGTPLGYFKKKFLSLGGGFNVFDNANQQVAEVKGNWKGKEFKFLTKSGREIGTVAKKFAGFGKELFTSADNYIISLSDPSSAGPAASALLLAAGLAIDVVFKED
jgi:uncharacterized protein YxjI